MTWWLKREVVALLHRILQMILTERNKIFQTNLTFGHLTKTERQFWWMISKSQSLGQVVSRDSLVRLQTVLWAYLAVQDVHNLKLNNSRSRSRNGTKWRTRKSTSELLLWVEKLHLNSHNQAKMLSPITPSLSLIKDREISKHKMKCFKRQLLHRWQSHVSHSVWTKMQN